MIELKQSSNKEFRESLITILTGLGNFLIEKNESYGDSALNPVRVFSKADPIEQINVRLDDKLSRMMRGGEYQGDNDEEDLLGYLILKQIAKLKASTYDVSETLGYAISKAELENVLPENAVEAFAEYWCDEEDERKENLGEFIQRVAQYAIASKK